MPLGPDSLPPMEVRDRNEDAYTFLCDKIDNYILGGNCEQTRQGDLRKVLIKVWSFPWNSKFERINEELVGDRICNAYKVRGWTSCSVQFITTCGRLWGRRVDTAWVYLETRDRPIPTYDTW